MSSRFIIVQHAEKEPGPGDPGLSALGVEHAVVVADRLAALEVAALRTSPSRRALETARPISERLGLAVVIDERLRERMEWNDESQSLHEFLTEWAKASHDRDFEPRSGQSSRAAGRRLEGTLRDFAGQHAGATVVIVCHGGVTVDMARNLVGDTVVEEVAPGLIDAGPPPGSITEILEEEGAFRLETLGSATWTPSN